MSERKWFGCYPFIGQGESGYVRRNKFNKTATCPIYFGSTPFIRSLIDDLQDYKIGAIGNIDTIGTARLGYLRLLKHHQTEREADFKKKLDGYSKN
jgi:hypothetical protein